MINATGEIKFNDLFDLTHYIPNYHFHMFIKLINKIFF